MAHVNAGKLSPTVVRACGGQNSIRRIKQWMDDIKQWMGRITYIEDYGSSQKLLEILHKRMAISCHQCSEDSQLVKK